MLIPTNAVLPAGSVSSPGRVPGKGYRPANGDSAALPPPRLKIREIVRGHFQGNPDAIDPTADDADARSAQACCEELATWLTSHNQPLPVAELVLFQRPDTLALDPLEIRELWDLHSEGSGPRPLEFARAVEDRIREKIRTALRVALPAPQPLTRGIGTNLVDEILGYDLLQRIDEDRTAVPVLGLSKQGQALLQHLAKIDALSKAHADSRGAEDNVQQLRSMD